jgi:hypothetical protein
MTDQNELSFKAISEDIRGMYDSLYERYDVRSFAELAEIEKAGNTVEDLEILTSMLSYMLYNVDYYSENKISDARKLVEEYSELAIALLAEGTEVKEKQSLIDKARQMISEFVKRSKKNKSSETKEKNNNSFMVFKDNSGDYRWFTSYSNNYRDDDRPREIISKESHTNFVDMVDSGQVDYPELWHWHTPGTAWGKADWVAYDEENGIAMASGKVLKGHEDEAIALMNSEIEIGVSHGMPRSTVQRDEKDNTVIRRHITVEISDLPKWAAANQLTDFYVFEEKDSMSIPKAKRDYLKSVGVPEDTINLIDQENAAKAKQADELNLESKDASAVTDTVETQVEAEKAESKEEKETEATEPVTETDETEKKESEVVVEFITKDNLTSVVELLSDLIKSGFEGVNQKIDAIDSRVVEVENKEKADPIPSASLAALLAQQVVASNAKENVVRKNSPLLKNAPVETASTEDEQTYSNNPLANAVMSSIFKK